jgi:hypothetical protein
MSVGYGHWSRVLIPFKSETAITDLLGQARPGGLPVGAAGPEVLAEIAPLSISISISTEHSPLLRTVDGESVAIKRSDGLGEFGAAHGGIRGEIVVDCAMQ